MMVKETRTKATVAMSMAVNPKPRPTEAEIIEEILRAVGLEALD